MDKKQYSNPLGSQVLSLPSMVDEQVDYCFSDKVQQNIMTMAEAFDVRKIYITGCGDSIAAAGAMAPIIHKMAGVFQCQMVEPMDFTRFMPAGDIGIGEPNSPLVIGISAGGSTSRVVEAMRKANEMGAFTIALTNNGESAVAKEAKRSFVLNTPKMQNDFPGLRSYFASMVGLLAIACRLGRVRNVLPPGAEKVLADSLKEYVHAYAGVMDDMDTDMFELARTWKDFERFDFIGDDKELYSALFAMEKFIECTGILANYDDSENWCHVGYHIAAPETIGTIFFADACSADYGRLQETVRAALAIKRPVLVITNGDKKDFPEEARVVRIPAAKPGNEWMQPMMDYAPAALLAGYCCTLAGRKFFNEYDPIAGEYNGSGKYFAEGIRTMKNSEIKIFI
ncbi:MAG TPA: SIS domain-containing protein [Candidatus Lachnoclostridium pullistercoris]|uniref:Glutamine--fructose-6-phosphate aminotransferase [isomerizing] n=1 Tax=Candidatus Lachnoclostridium pullistercoris TaxID=2838632 RepID=A0A9D2PGQ7_9FIRM|nr:SIS domain-containing protein [Candidatus Lachnoclostridium pullistercoris]